MDVVDTNGIQDTSMLTSKCDDGGTCDQNTGRIQLTKMEVVSDQSNVQHLENTPNSQHIVDTQYINIHRVSELKNLIPDSMSHDLLSHHVVDLGSQSEYSPHIVTNTLFYDNGDSLGQTFSEDDRRLGLVAVQLIQPNRNSNSTTEGDNIGNDLLNAKTTLPSVSSISTEKSVISSMVPKYVDPVETTDQNSIGMHMQTDHTHVHTDHTHVSEQHVTKEPQQNQQIIKLYQSLLPELPPLRKINQSVTPTSTKYDTDCSNQSIIVSTADMNSMQQMARQVISNPMNDVKVDASPPGELACSVNESSYEYESDGDNKAKSSQKSLPHKKRIPNKLKNTSPVTSTKSSNSKGYKCLKCSEHFPSQVSLNIHKMTHSSKKVFYACELCGKTCANQWKFFEHLKSHYEPNKSLKDVGPKEVSTEVMETTPEPVTAVRSQENCDSEPPQVNDSEEPAVYPSESHKVFTCGKCGRVFRRQKAFDCHMSISHPKQEDIEEFSEPEDMMEGIRHVVNMVPAGDEDEKTYETWESPKNIENVIIQQQLQQPQQQQQQQQQAQQQQQQQQQSIKLEPSSAPVSAPPIKIPPVKSFPTSSPSVKSEKSDDFSEDDFAMAKPRKEMNCPHCERTFVHRNSLLYHIRSHTGHRPHQCELCGKSFFAAGALKIHLRLHSGDKPYKCEHCGRFFRQWGDLKYHITSLHSNTKMFQCEYCGKDFARKYSLVVHRRIHTGEKNYICEFCTKTFRAASYLQNHRRIHTGEKPHTCHVCGKPFRVRSDMKRHMKTHPDANVNVLTEVSNTTNENHESRVVMSSAVANNHEASVAKQETASSSPIVSDPDPEHNLKPVISESGTPLNLNVRPEHIQQELYTYQRNGLEDDRENANTNTLFVWIETSPNQIVPDA